MKQSGFYVVRSEAAKQRSGGTPMRQAHRVAHEESRTPCFRSGAGESTACRREPFRKIFALANFCNGVASLEPLVKPRKAFTLAEVLLTLAVIGIVAAITLPSLMVDTTEKAFEAQRAALHARLTQAIGMMANLSGYGAYTATDPDNVTADTAAESFLYEGLSKVYKMNNICGYDGTSATSADILNKCNLPSKITTMAGNEIDFPTTLKGLNTKLINERGAESDISKTNTKVAAFETVNGESIAVFYNPSCRSDAEVGTVVASYGSSGPNAGKTFDYFYTQNRMCVNFIYDLNGLKGPNKVGKDIGFITALYDKSPEVVAPMPFATDVGGTHTQKEAVDKCASYADNSRLPNKHELSSLFYNKNLIGNYQENDAYWSSSVISPTCGWEQAFHDGDRGRLLRSVSYHVRCIRK